MGLTTKGIVSSQNYTFSAANKTITFSSDYTGMSLSDITYITNIKSGVATVIYDPFDTTKGGVLSGLVLTLAYNTTLMADDDPLQIIVGFVAPEQPKEDTNEKSLELLQDIADNIDQLVLTTDEAERIQVNTREINPAKRDFNNAQVVSDAVQFTKTIARVDSFVIETTGYQSVEFTSVPFPSISATATIESSPDGINWNNDSFYAPTSNTTTMVIASSALSIASVSRFIVPAYGKFVRFRITTYTSGTAFVTATLRQTPLPMGLMTQLPINVLNTVSASTAINAGTGTTATGLPVSSPYIATTQPPNAASSLQTNVPFPLGIGGREQPYIGALGGLFRYITVDGGGRYILGGDTPATETRTASTKADGSISGLPPRGIGGRPNSMQGGQTLLVEDIGQSEGDTTPTLLQQILIELKMLNQQINELPHTINMGLAMQNEVAEYRQEEFNNHVNNQ